MPSATAPTLIADPAARSAQERRYFIEGMAGAGVKG